MDLSELRFIRLTPQQELKPSDCSDGDLNDFFYNEAKSYQEGLLAVTYIIETETETVAFYSLLNDKIAMEDFDTNSQWYRKSAIVYPSIKGIKVTLPLRLEGLE